MSSLALSPQDWNLEWKLKSIRKGFFLRNWLYSFSIN